MSETVTFKGRLKLVACGIPQVEGYSRNYLESINSNFPLPDYYKSYYELVVDDYNHVLVGENLYQVITKNEMSSEDIFEASKVNENEIDYLVQYYNGGCSFSEAIGYSLKSIETGTKI